MTSTPISLNDESLNGSWIDVRSASQIQSPIDTEPPERPNYSHNEAVQSLGFISFQVERFLQEVQRNQTPATNNQNNANVCDNISDLYLSDTDVSVDGSERKAMISSLKQIQKQEKSVNTGNMLRGHQNVLSNMTNQRLSKSGDCLADQLSDSLSFFSRASAIEDTGNNLKAASFQDFDWIWDWTAQPEYFAGQEWKVHTPKQDYLMRQRQLYCANLREGHDGPIFSGEMMSLLFLTNMLSIIIGAGLTYSILMRKTTP